MAWDAKYETNFWRPITAIRAADADGNANTVADPNWTPLIIFALSSQVLGQGLLVYSIGHFPPLVVGLALLTQPAVSALVGWFAYDERMSAGDVVGAIAIGAALILVRLPGRGLRRRGVAAS